MTTSKTPANEPVLTGTPSAVPEATTEDEKNIVRTRNRSAESGEFVSKDEAEQNPATTVTEKIDSADKGTLSRIAELADLGLADVDATDLSLLSRDKSLFFQIRELARHD